MRKPLDSDVASLKVDIVILSLTMWNGEVGEGFLIYEYGFNAQDMYASVVIMPKVQGSP